MHSPWAAVELGGSLRGGQALANSFVHQRLVRGESPEGTEHRERLGWGQVGGQGLRDQE